MPSLTVTSLKPHKNLPVKVDSTGGWYLEPGSWMHSDPWDFSHTNEVRLRDLGRFPLPDEQKGTLEMQLEIENTVFTVPDFFKSSQIPIFYAQDGRMYLPRGTLAIARYFYDMWQSSVPEEILDTDMPALNDEDSKILSGIGILRSFYSGAGVSKLA
ncbi:MAG: hypothetical protein KDK41_00460 [Leptospiraceae bacterium]|nr:hypothetical protein [Leptospiraceae bacterium]